MRPTPVDRLQLEPFRILDKDWALLVAGTASPNPMTVSWGGFGTLWNRPVCTVFVRPTRHTFECLEQSAAFTLNFLAPELRHALAVCGDLSGRDVDKWKAAGIAPVASQNVKVPRVAGTILSLECKILATADIDPARFLDRSIDALYPEKDYHRVYWGEVLLAWSA